MFLFNINTIHELKSTIHELYQIIQRTWRYLYTIKLLITLKKLKHMKKLFFIALCCFGLMANNVSLASTTTKTIIYSDSKINIKIKNDSDNEITVINAGSGGTYKLSKNIVVTIKMEEGDKLFVYEKGKKGALLLEASPEMDGKVQLLSKL